MANSRRSGKTIDHGRDPGGFVALPWTVLDSSAYQGLSVHAKALLMEVARQSHHDNNGRLLLSRAYLGPRGWKSSDMIMKAKRELLDAELIFETVKGCRPNKASWYAVTWRMLDRIPGFDSGVTKAFVRGAYLKKGVPHVQKTRSLDRPTVQTKPSIAPPHSTEAPAPVPHHGAISATFAPLSVPSHGHPLEVAIYGVQVVGVPAADPAIALNVAYRAPTLQNPVEIKI